MTRGSARRVGRGLLFVLGALAFSSAIGNRLEALDDARIILGQPFLRSVTLANLVKCVWPLPVREEWLPVRDLTLMADFALHGGRPEGFVATNLLLHGAVVVAVYGLLRRALRRTPRREAAAAAGAALFAVHPMHLESVVWASGRKDLLVALFVVLAASRWLDAGRARRTDAERRRRLEALALGATALLCKASAVCLPLLLVAADLAFACASGRAPERAPAGSSAPGAERVDAGPRGAPSPRHPARPGEARAWARRLLWLAPLAVTCGLFTRGYTHLLAEFARGSGDVIVKQFPGSSPLVTIVCTDAHVVRQYLQRLVLPLDLHPFSDQGYRTGLDGEVALGFVVCAAALVGLIALTWRRPGPAFLVAWSWLALTPFLNLVPHGIPYAERYTHLASVGVCGLLGLVVVRAGTILARRRADRLRVTGVVLGGVVFLWTFACLGEARSFATGETLWTRVVRGEPDNAVALSGLGVAVLDREPQRAQKLFERALAKDPSRHTAAYHLGLLAERAGQLDEALRRYREAARARPSHVGSLTGAARVLAKQGRWEAAVALQEEVMTRWPESAARAAWDRASTLEQAGQAEVARQAWRQYLERWGRRAGEETWAAEARSRLSR